MKRKKIIIWMGISILILTCMRLLWLVIFMPSGQENAVNGQLDLRGRSTGIEQTVTLDGEWDFYPNEWIINHDTQVNVPSNHKLLIDLPSSWNAYMDQEQGTSSGYGSYHLRILINPEENTTYSLYIPSVRSSSELFVNGQKLGQSGQIATSKDNYIPQNIPYSASFLADGRGVIDIVIQVANYDDARNGGIIRSMKFGRADALLDEVRLSSAMQEIICFILFIHAIYALIIYMIGNRDTRLLYFSLIIICLVFIFSTSGDKVLFNWIPVPYDWDFKLKFFSICLGCYSFLQCVRPHSTVGWRNRCFLIYSIFCGISSAIILLLPLEYLMAVRNIYLSVSTLSGLIAFYYLFDIIRISNKSFLLLLTAIAIFSQGIWEMIFIITGIKVMFYPFDILVAMIAFLLIWVKHYFYVFDETKKLAIKLQRMDEVKDEFLANTSHELRNPLHGILNFSQSVLDREGGSLNDRSVRDLEMVITVGRQMSFMLSDLLDTMRLKESGILLTTDHLSLNEVATTVMESLRFMTEGKPVQLMNYIPDNFPLVVADEQRLVQILFNLLHNAIKFTSKGEVSIHADIRDGRASIVIVDTGIGMNKELMSRIFEPYEQGCPSSSMGGGGFGLGLSICKQLVELHGGTLEVSSTQGEGSAFSFSLALSKFVGSNSIEIRDISALAEHAATTTTTASDDKLMKAVKLESSMASDRTRILIVDDDPINLILMESIFSLETNYEIIGVTNAQEAISALDSGKWDLVITDVMMPNKSGYELTEWIRERFDVYELPILLLTARTRPEDVEAGFLSGANDYVTKPVNAIELRARVKGLTNFKKSVEERLSLKAAWNQAQIKPHFIFNALNAVVALSEIDIHRMHALLDDFSTFLRASIDFQNSEQFVQLDHELELVQSYLNIEKERFGDRLTVVWEVDEGLRIGIPPLSIQPLVENAVIHGVLTTREGGTITIRIIDHAEFVNVCVEDDGVGMTEDKVKLLLSGRPDLSLGIGLRNTNLRLKQLYGRGLEIVSVQGEGTKVTFNITKHLSGS